MSHTSQANRRSSVWGSLRLRLTVAVTLAVVLVSAVGIAIDYRREYRVHLSRVLGSLEEQAHALAAARRRINDPEQFALYMDDFCAQMNTHISPGHHILVLDKDGAIQASTRHHSGPAVERALVEANPKHQVLVVEDHQLAQARLQTDDGASIVVAQYLDHMEGILRSQLVSRILATAAVSAGIIVLVFLALHLWAVRHISRLAEVAGAWADRNFSARARPAGPSELHLLCEEFNAMAGELERHEQRRTAELELAKMIQRNLLPTSLPAVQGLDIAAEYRPVEHVAGDLYDVFQVPDGRTAVAILDVSGHGITAALLTGLVKMSLRYRMTEARDPAAAVVAVNQDLLSCILDGQFVTACLGLWDPSERTWTYAAAGHSGGLLLTSGQAQALDYTGPLLGVIPDGPWHSRTIKLSVGDRLLLYTDGLVEVGAREHRQLGFAGLAAAVVRAGDLNLRRLLASVLAEAVKCDSGGPQDDITMIGLEVRPE